MNKITRFTLRIDDELLEVIKKSAIKNKRSVAKEIEFILTQEAIELGYSPKDE